MPRSILVVNGHPDPSPERFCHALCDSYSRGAEDAGNAVMRVDAGALDFGFLGSSSEFATPPPPDMAAVQAMLARADHMVLIHPLWLGTLPARTKAFLEHLARHEFLLQADSKGGWPVRRMRGKSARLVVTMGMPAFAYRLLFRAHSLKAVEAGVFAISGFKPVRHTILGGVEMSPQGRANMLAKMHALGRAGR